MITDKGGSPRFYMQVDPRAFGMDPVMASSFFAAIDMFSKEVFDQKAPVYHIDYGARIFTLIGGVNTNLIAVSTLRLNQENIDMLDSLLAEFELDWLEIVDPFDYSFDTSFVEVYLESFGERVMEKLSFTILPDSWIPYFTITPETIPERDSTLAGFIDGSRNVKEIIEVSGLSQREITLEMSRLWAHRIIRFRNLLNFNDFLSARTQFLRYVQATSNEIQELRKLHPEMVNILPRLAGLLDGRKTVREILAEIGSHHDEREALRALDFLLENRVIEVLSPEKRRILLAKEALEITLRVAEESYSKHEAASVLNSVMNRSDTPETLGQLQFNDGRWTVDFDFKILEGLSHKRVMLLYGEWMKILAQFAVELGKEKLDIFIENLTWAFIHRIINRYSDFDLRGFEEFAFWLEILSNKYRPHVGAISTTKLRMNGTSTMEELANILITRGHIIYRTDRIGKIPLSAGSYQKSTLDDDEFDHEDTDTFKRIMIEYSKLGPAAKITLLILCSQRGIPVPGEILK
ncbi:MAG: hypothetical protein RTU30_01430 [Candidatus Thorarchaeota archaeon]